MAATSIHFPCAHCGARIKAPLHLNGSRRSCPRCCHAVTVPQNLRQSIGLHTERRDVREGDIVNDAGRIAKIVKIYPETTVLDLNHPLAGKPLIVTLQIVTIENPDEDELDKNTVTGKGDHQDLVIINPGNGFVPVGRDLQRFST